MRGHWILINITSIRCSVKSTELTHTFALISGLGRCSGAKYAATAPSNSARNSSKRIRFWSTAMIAYYSKGSHARILHDLNHWISLEAGKQKEPPAISGAWHRSSHRKNLRSSLVVYRSKRLQFHQSSQFETWKLWWQSKVPGSRPESFTHQEHEIIMCSLCCERGSWIPPIYLTLHTDVFCRFLIF